MILTLQHMSLAAAALTASSLAAHAGDLPNDEKLLNEMALSALATRIDADCKKIALDRTATAARASELMTYISEAGYSKDELLTLNTPEYLAAISAAVDEKLATSGVASDKKGALCAFAKRELRQGSSELAQFLMKNG